MSHELSSIITREEDTPDNNTSTALASTSCGTSSPLDVPIVDPLPSMDFVHSSNGSPPAMTDASSSVLCFSDTRAARVEGALACGSISEAEWLDSLLSFPPDTVPVQSVDSGFLDTSMYSSLPDLSITSLLRHDYQLTMSPIFISIVTEPTLPLDNAAQDPSTVGCHTCLTLTAPTLDLSPVYSISFDCEKTSEPRAPDSISGSCASSDLGKRATEEVLHEVNSDTLEAANTLLTLSTEDTRPVAHMSADNISANLEPRADYPSGQLSIRSEDVGPNCATLAITGSGSSVNDPIVLDDSLEVVVQSGKEKRANPRPMRPRKRPLASEGSLLWGDPSFKNKNTECAEDLFKRVIASWMELRDLPQLSAVKIIVEFDTRLKDVEAKYRALSQLRIDDLDELETQYIATSQAALQQLQSKADKSCVFQLRGLFDQLRACSEIAKLLEGTTCKPAKRRRKS